MPPKKNRESSYSVGTFGHISGPWVGQYFPNIIDEIPSAIPVGVFTILKLWAILSMFGEPRNRARIKNLFHEFLSPE